MFRFLLLLLVFVLVSLPSWAGELRVLTELTGNSAMYEGEELIGSGVEIVREIMRRTGDEHEIEVVPWMRGYDALMHDPGVALFSTTRTEEREPLFHWVGPIIRLHWLFLARKGQGRSIKTLEDARNVKAIGTYRGDARDQYLTKIGFTNLDRSTNSTESFRKLVLGRVDLVMATTVGMDTTLEAAGVNKDELEIAFMLRQMDLYIAFSRGTAFETIHQWRAALDAMKQDGTFQRIYQKWYPGQEPPLK